MNQQKPEEECCPRFDPQPWNDVVLKWEDKKFIKDKVFTIFYMPVNFSSVIKRMNNKILNANAIVPDYMNLSDHTSKWKMDLYIAVNKEVPGAENFSISGNYYSRVYEGPYNNAGRWMADFSRYTENKGLRTGRQFLWYTTCPKCAKKYGENYVVIIAQVLQ